VLRSQQVAITGSAVGLADITGHLRHAILVNSGRDVVVAGLAMRGNLTTVETAQINVLDSSGVTLSALAVSGPALGGIRTGVYLTSSSDVRLGHGSVVSDHAFQGVVVDRCQDVSLGNWQAGGGVLAVQGRQPLHVTDSQRVSCRGDGTAATTLESSAAASDHVVFLVRSDDLRIGPAVTVDGRGGAASALQASQAARLRLEGVRAVGHRSFGLLLDRCAAGWLGFCRVDGRVGAVAAGDGVLLNGGCDGTQLVGNEVRGQEGSAFKVVDSGDVTFLPGNRAIDNRGDAFAADDTGAGPPRRRVVLQSVAAVGRSTGNAVRGNNVLIDASNVTATRHDIGFLLQRGTQATIVNSISYDNARFDRARDSSATGRMSYCVVRTSSGSGTPGAWVDSNSINSDPRFVSAATGDVRLASGSPAIDSGLHFTPLGTTLPSVDVDLQPRIRGGRIDRGCSESVPGSGSGNSLELIGAWLRPLADSQLRFTLDFGAAGPQGTALLLGTSSGTGPGFRLPDNTLLPFVPDGVTQALLSIPAWSLVPLSNGRGAVDVFFPPWLLPYLPPELTYVAVPPDGGTSSNPVVVRFVR
jgi:hypothetical protein